MVIDIIGKESREIYTTEANDSLARNHQRYALSKPFEVYI